MAGPETTINKSSLPGPHDHAHDTNQMCGLYMRDLDTSEHDTALSVVCADLEHLSSSIYGLAAPGSSARLRRQQQQPPRPAAHSSTHERPP